MIGFRGEEILFLMTEEIVERILPVDIMTVYKKLKFSLIHK
jgi:hypothetical protein